jgi:peptidoglycan hydrolase CwlO-like protein
MKEIPTYHPIIDEDNPEHGIVAIHLVHDSIMPNYIKTNNMSDKKQSGYQKLKAELEAAQAKIKELEAQLATINPSEPAA